MALIGLLEDNARIAKLCVTLLHYAGHEVTVYEHPQQCLHALLPEGGTSGLWNGASSMITSLPVEVLIMDLCLPDIDGVEVLRHLQSDPYTRILPLILCTAAPNAEVARALRVAPHAGLVEKPFKLQSLTSAITTALNAALE